MINKSRKTATEDSYIMEWQDLTLTHHKTEKKLLDKLSGRYQSGDFLAIMGPSGAGKSSLLTVITARLRSQFKQFTMEGTIHINGQNYSLKDFSRIAAYVPQDDLLFGTLTVKETFMFQCKLKLWSLSQQQQEQRSMQAMKRMNLLQCQDSLIGNGQFKKSISGGQKKRVAIGIELLSNPQILIFDEPTSGLDSHNALMIIKLLKKLAQQQHKLIITTIHQPSSLIFQNLDLLYLIKGGYCIYNGKASQIVSYMEKLKIAINYRMNPADFFMLEMSMLKQKQGYKTPLNSQNYYLHASNYQKIPNEHYFHEKDNSTTNSTKSMNHSNQRTPFFKQFQPLMLRSYLSFMRTPSNQLNKLVAAFFIPIILGLMYIGAANGAPQDISSDPYAFSKFILQFPAFIFMAAYFVFAMNTYDTILVFPIQKQLVLKEVNSNLYSIISYYFARLFAQFLGSVIPGIISGILLYFIVDMDMNPNRFCFFVGIFAFLAFQGYIFGIFFGVMCKNTTTGITILPIFLIAFLIVGGLPCNLNDVPSYISWMQYISPMRHGFFILLLDQLKSAKMHHYFNNPYILNRLGIYGDIYEPLYWQIGLFSFYFIGSIVLLYWMKSRM